MNSRYRPLLVMGLVAIALLGSRAAQADIPGPVVKLDITEGQTLQDRLTVTAKTLPSPDGSEVNKVDFAVDDQVKGSDTSVPYTFELNTLDYTEGSHTVSATATDEKGKATTTKVTVTFNNALDKGADYHANLAIQALQNNDTATAEKEARVALKIDPKNLKLARALAGTYRKKGDIRGAYNVLANATIPETEYDARMDLARMTVALALTSGATSDPKTLLAQAGDTYAKALRAKQQNAAADGDAGARAIAAGDAAMALGEWDRAVDEYTKSTPGDVVPVNVANRMVLAYLNGGRLRDARGMAGLLVNNRRANATTRALIGLVELQDQQFAKAQEAVKADLKSTGAGTPLLTYIVGAYAALGLGDSDKARLYAESARALSIDVPAVSIVRSHVLADAPDRLAEAQRAVELNPLSADAYANLGFVMVVTQPKGSSTRALPMFQEALNLDVKNRYGKMGMVLARIPDGLFKEALPEANAFAIQNPNAADAFMMLAVVNTGAGRQPQVYPAMERALKLDPKNWNDPLVPRGNELAAKIYRWRCPAGVTPAVLDMNQVM